MKLLPDSAHAYDQYWQSIRLYNRWFIKLRWFAVIFVFIYWITLKFLFTFQISTLQNFAFIIVALLMIGYNFVFYLNIEKENSNLNSNPLLFSLLQIVLDLISLSVIVYFSGGLESPVFLLYIFHMIIGSLILPSSIMYGIAAILLLNLSIYSVLEYFGIIPHQGISGFLPFTLYDKPIYLIGILIISGLVIFITVMLTHKIASELYGREKHLKKALDELNESEKSKQKYVMAVVHELKSPIVASLSQLDLVLGKFVGNVDEQVLNRVQISKDRSIEAIGMINSILHISNYRLFKKLDFSELLIEPIILSVLKTIYLVAEQKKVSIQFVDNENKSKKVGGDEILLNLAISNLVGNAVKYNKPNGRVHVNIKDEGDSRIVEIIDDGIGIPSNEAEKVFEDYYRASNAGNIEGAGIGLSIVKQIIENHNGKLEFKSPSRLEKKGRPGTEFKIILPIK